MRIQAICLICSIFIASCTAYLSEWPRVMKVTEANKHEFGLPVGTTLKKDRRTKLYIPPKISDKFNPEARLEVQWGNKQTGRNFCKVGPGIEGRRINRAYYWNTWCRNTDGEDICCGETRCSCNLTGDNCACLTKEGFEYYEQKKQIDFHNTLSTINTITNVVNKIALPIATGGAAGK